MTSRLFSCLLLICGLIMAALLLPRAATAQSADYDLLLRHAPVVYGHRDEIYPPVAVDASIHIAELHYGNGQVLANPFPSQLDDAPYNAPDSLLKFPCTHNGDTSVNCTRPLFNQFYLPLDGQPGWTPHIYGRVDRSDPATITLQYWFFYYYNPSIDIDVINLSWHEGDWELAQVVLAADETPQYVAYAQHGTSTKRLWQHAYTDGDHPQVFVGKGTHASFFTPFPYYLYGIGQIAVHDRPGFARTLWHPDSDSISLLSGNEPWLAFEGDWGSDGGPSGPAQKNSWANPLSVGEDWDELAPHNRNKFVCSSTYPGDVDVVNNITGRHTGRQTDGTVVTDIPASEYIENPAAQARTVLLHAPTPPQALFYTCNVLNRTASAVTVTVTLNEPGVDGLNARQVVRTVTLAAGESAEIGR